MDVEWSRREQVGQLKPNVGGQGSLCTSTNKIDIDSISADLCLSIVADLIVRIKDGSQSCNVY